jgi:hypothetical protein
MKPILTLMLILALLLTAAPAFARNVDLSTVPDRASVSLTIYNSEDLTLVRETRTISFKKGMNPLQFSWANTLIDPTSVELRFLKNADKLEVLDTTYPHDKPAMLYWNIQSDIDGEATVEITYFTSGIGWTADYTCIADNAEKEMGFEGFVRVSNRSGEDYENAKVRLVVGTINLVEKIARLANIPMQQVGQLEGAAKAQRKREAAKEAMLDDRADGPSDKDGMAMNAVAATKAKQIIKEGLSEYFIYTIEGTENIPNGWSKRMRSFEGTTVPMKIQYRYRPNEYGNQLVRMYLLTNNKESKLGTTPLPNGQVRVFRNNGRDGLSYLAAQNIKYVPIGDKIELNLGPDPEVIFELIKLKNWRDNIWMQINGGDVFQQVGGGVAIDVNSSVAGWDDHELYTQRIRNYTPRAIEVEVRRSYGGHVVFRSNFNPAVKLYDFQTVEFTTNVDAGKRADLYHEVITKQGRNSKQSNITLEQADIKP